MAESATESKTRASATVARDLGAIDIGSVGRPSRMPPRLWSARLLFWAVSIVVLAVPFLIVILRLVFTTRHIYLPGDVAIIDLSVRRAIHFQQSLGPYDRFGWHHPGPSYFYLLSVVARVLGPGGRADYVGATLINFVSAVGAVLVVGRYRGPRAAVWAAVCVGVLAIALSPGANFDLGEGPIGGFLVYPWNPIVVIFPLLLFAVLCAAGGSGSWPSLLGAAVVGSFAVQTDISTLPVVVVLLVAAAGARILIEISELRSGASGRARSSRPVVATSAAAAVVLVAMWLPPVIEELTSSSGNVSRLWRFFTAHHQGHSLSAALYSILTVDRAIPLGTPRSLLGVLGLAPTGAWFVFLAVVVVGLGTTAIGIRNKDRLGVALGLVSLTGFIVFVLAGTRIVGPIWGYLEISEIGLPLVGIMAVGILILGSRTRREGEPRAVPAWQRHRALDVGVCVLALFVGVVLTERMATLPSLTSTSNPSVAAAWRDVAPELGRPGPGVSVMDAGTDLDGVSTFLGLFNELQARGFRPTVQSFWEVAIGPEFVSKKRQPVTITLYPPSRQVENMAGYVGHTAHADVVVHAARERGT